jgi:hypothetical protein
MLFVPLENPTENAAIRMISVAKLVTAGFTGRPCLSLQSLSLQHFKTGTARHKSGHDEALHFLLFGLWPAGVLPDENGEGVAPPFFMFLSAFGFFFSLLLRI